VSSVMSMRSSKANRPKNVSIMRRVRRKGSQVAEALVDWGAANYREFSWRRSEAPYGYLVAEMLLKRTTATAVARVYDNFMDKYPTFAHLARAPLDALERDLFPLGLHRQRSRDMLRLTEAINELPSVATLPDLLKLPGLGSYSARALLSFAYGQPAAIVDSNVERVLRRVFSESLPERLGTVAIQELAEAIVPRDRHREFNYAILDLGALVCRPVHQKCGFCPVARYCDWYAGQASPNSVVI